MLVVAMLSLLSLPGWADYTLRDLTVRRTGGDIKATVSVDCSGAATADTKLALFIRPDPTAPWEPVAAWTDLKPGEPASRTFCSAGNGRVQQITGRTRFELKARVQQGDRYREITRAFLTTQ